MSSLKMEIEVRDTDLIHFAFVNSSAGRRYGLWSVLVKL
jgi:hypothetical protein